MNVVKNEFESEILGLTVLDLKDLEGDEDIAAIEREYIERFDPAYVASKVPQEDMRSIHLLEDAGFNLVEIQFRMTLKLRGFYDTSSTPYEFKLVETEDALDEVLDMVKDMFIDDRFYVDPQLPDSKKLSAARYRAFVRRSFERPDERVYQMINPSSAETLAFKTHRILSDNEALLLLGGVHPDYRKTGIAPLNEHFEFNELLRGGIKRITTHVAARNYAIINLEVRGFRFRVRQSFAVLRKLYRTSAAGSGGPDDPDRWVTISP